MHWSSDIYVSLLVQVFTCSSESVLAGYMAMSTPKLKIYKDVDSLCLLPKKIASELESLQEKVVIFVVVSSK